MQDSSLKMSDIDKDSISVRGFDIEKLAELALQKPEDFGWWGKEEMFTTWGWAGIDMNNSSDAVEIVNFKIITDDLYKRYPDDFEIVGLRHWAVSHVDRLTCRILINEKLGCVKDNITDAFCAAMLWKMNLEEYPVADDEALYEHCYNEMLEWITSEMPAEVYIANSKEDTAGVILEEMYQDYEFDPDSWVLEGRYPTDDMIRYIAYDLSLCATEYKEFWDEWVTEQGLPTIHWGDNFGANANKVYHIDGQLNLFEENDANN